MIDFTEVSGSPLPCVFVPGDTDEYDYALTAVPGEALRFVYERFGARLLEANVRSFLSVKGKGVNAGIQNTLRTSPGHFMAYNNGIVLVADEMRLATAADGSPGIAWLKGMQIVNGGQTTASLYFAKKKYPETDPPLPAPDVAAFKAMVAKALVFKSTHKLVRPMFQAFQANVAAYTVSLLSHQAGDRFDLDRVWSRQGVSQELLAQLSVWAREVNDVLHRTSGGRMVSEWAKKPECKDAVLCASYSDPATGIPELR